MADENKNTSQDDEYQFPQDEYASSGEAKSQPTVNEADDVAHVEKKSVGETIIQFLRNASFIKNKRILIAIGVVIVLFLVFHFSNDKTQQPAAPVAVQAAPVEQPSDQNALAAYKARTESQIQNLESQLSAMQNNLSAAQAENQTLQNSIAALTAQIQGLTARLEAALIKPQVPGKRLVYHLRAVLPDRAWITSSTGETKTVTMGDYIKQYGTVQQIDSQRGMIVTSSGRKIVYGPNDY